MKSKQIVQTTRNKALILNQDPEYYGSFAEIGAGQEVARHFFRAGLASQTVAKSMSAYDKVFSDAIYGKGSRFVSAERLKKMLAHEFELLQDRLTERASKSSFFAFANTVATSSHEEIPTCHGWMGIRFQTKPHGPSNDIILHVKMLDRLRLQQQEALGALGVNLAYAARLQLKEGKDLIESLLDNLSPDRLEIDCIYFDGPDLEHIDSRLMCLELVNSGLSKTVMFDEKGQPLCPSDALYKKNIFVQRGTFRPVTLTNIKILEKGLKHFRKDVDCKKEDTIVFLEISMSGLKQTGKAYKRDFLDRVDAICATGNCVLVSNFQLYSELVNYMRRLTDQGIGLVIGASTLEQIMNPKFYQHVLGGMLGAFSRLFEGPTKLYVYPFKQNNSCTTAASFVPPAPTSDFYSYLRKSKCIVDIDNCEDVDTSFHSEKVRELLSSGKKDWENLVPKEVRDLMKKRKMFQD